MAVSGSIVYTRHQTFGPSRVARRSGSVVYTAHRVTSGLYAGEGITASSNLAGLKAWLPAAHVPVVKTDGLMADQWYRFFNYLVNIQLGGPTAPTLRDIASTVTTAQEQAATVAATTAGLTQQVAQNAEALHATVEVAQNNSLPGATQIPTVQRTTLIEP